MSADVLALRKTAGVALYLQVKSYLEDLIQGGLEAGDLLPSQSEIACKTGTSMITVKRALKELELEGVVDCGSGRRASVRRDSAIDNRYGVTSWTDTVAGLGETSATAWIRMSERAAPAKVARLLRLKSRGRTAFVERLRTANGRPVALMINEIPVALVPGLTEQGLSHESLYESLAQDFSLHPAAAEEEVSARRPTEEEREFLQIKNDIVMVINRLTFDAEENPIECAQAVLPASRFRYRTRLLNK